MNLEQKLESHALAHVEAKKASLDQSAMLDLFEGTILKERMSKSRDQRYLILLENFADGRITAEEAFGEVRSKIEHLDYVSIWRNNAVNPREALKTVGKFYTFALDVSVAGLALSLISGNPWFVYGTVSAFALSYPFILVGNKLSTKYHLRWKALEKSLYEHKEHWLELLEGNKKEISEYLSAKTE